MATIDERVVAMVFDNAKFEAGVAQTMKTLGKLDTTLQQIGSKNSLGDIEKSASKITLEQPMSALDKLKAKFSRSGSDAADGLNEIEKAGNKVTLEQPVKALEKVQTATADVGRGAATGFNEIEKASSRVNLQGLNSAMDSVTAKISVLQGAAAVALGNLQTQLVGKATSWAKGFTVAPILDGLHEYQTNLKAIQTVQANTDQPLTKINKSLAELNHYSDQTIYNFGEMAKNVGTFTAAGVDLKTSVSSIKGIANMAALSGSSSQQAATAMYQLSQAISSGRVGLQDWNSVVNAGMGGKKLQNALAQTAVAMGDIGKNSVKLEGPMKKLTINGQSFRESIMAVPGQTSWLSSDILVNTLASLDGRFSRAALGAELTKDGLKKYTKAQIESHIATARANLEAKNGVKYTDEQFKALMKLSDAAFKSATEVKTLGQVFDIAKETIGSGWSASFQSIFGNLGEAKKTFTEMSGAINGFINANALARNTVLHDWKELGGRTVLIQGIKDAFKALFSILKPIGQAFRDIFPRKTGEDLFEMTKNFAAFTKGLIPAQSTIESIRRIFRGLFAVLHIGWEVVKGVIGVFGTLLGQLGDGSGGFLNFAGSIGDFLVAVDSALTKGGLLSRFFSGLASILKIPLSVLQGLAGAIFGIFGGLDEGKANVFAGSMDKVNGAAGPLAKTINFLKSAWDKLVRIFRDAKELVSPWLEEIGNQLSNVGSTIGDAFKTLDFDKMMSAVSTGFVGAIFLSIKKGVGGFGGNISEVLGNVNNALGGLTGHLQAMQQKVKAQIILTIAGAVGILAAAVFLLSKVPADKLTVSMTAITVGLGQVAAVMFLMGNMMKTTGRFNLSMIAGMPALAASMVMIAGAMVILAAAAKIFSTMSWEEIGKGMAGIAAGLTIMGLASKYIPPTLIAQSVAVGILAVALNILAAAVKQFASLSWEELGRGLAGVLGSLVALIAPITAAGPGLTVAAPGVIGIAFALNMLAGAVRAFGEMDLKTLGVGLAGAALGLVAIGGAMWAIPPHAIILGPGLIAVAIALNGIAGAVGLMGKIGIGAMVKGLAGLAASLTILAVGLTLMIAAAPGAVALMAAAAALAVIAPTLAFMGSLSWGTILKGLAGIALALGVISVVGSVAAPGIALLGVALLPFAGILLAAAAAASMFAKALALLAGDGQKGVTVMITAFTAFVAILPKIVIDFIKGLVSIFEELARVTPMIVEAISKILDSVIQIVINSAPRLALAIGVLIDSFLLVFTTKMPGIVRAGWDLIQHLLSGLAANMPALVSKGADIIVKFVSGLTAKLPSIMSAGGKLVVTYIQGIAKELPKVIGAAAKAVISFITGLARELPGVIAAGIRLVATFLRGIGQNIGKVYSAGVDLVIGLLKGIGENVPRLVNKAIDIAAKFVRTMASGLARLAGVGADAIISFINRLAEVIRQKGPQLRAAGWNLADAIIDGLVDGIKDLWGKVTGKIEELAGKLPGPFKKVLGIHSPSTVFYELGKNIVDGLALGVVGVSGELEKSITNPLKNMLRETKGVREMGRFLGKEFKDGLAGGLWDDGRSPAEKQIDDTFNTLRTKFADGQKKLEEQVKKGQDNLKKLNSDRKDNKKEIRNVAKDLLENQAGLAKAKKPADAKEFADKIKEDQAKLEVLLNARKGNQEKILKQLGEVASDKRLLESAKMATPKLMKSLQDERNALKALAVDYQDVSKDLEEAKNKLTQLQDQKKSFAESTASQYSTLPDIASLMDAALSEAEMTAQERYDAAKKKREEQEKRAKIDQVANYRKALEQQIADTKKYMDTLAGLRDLGLDDVTYRKLTEMGTKGQEFASQLLKGGKGGIDQLNALDSKLAEAAKGLSDTAANELYDAGIKAAEGLVKGLADRQTEIRTAMEQIANSMIGAIKQSLGIRSPSRVFAEIGKFAAQGMAQGLQASSQQVASAAQSVGDNAATALSSSLAKVTETLQNGVNSDLTITPVLDLSQVEKDASKIQDLTNVTPITAAASYGQASAIAQDREASAAVEAETAAESGGPTLKFEQTITSPKAIDEVEVYRQTNNQLAQAKRALGLVS